MNYDKQLEKELTTSINHVLRDRNEHERKVNADIAINILREIARIDEEEWEE